MAMMKRLNKKIDARPTSAAGRAMRDELRA
jgi:hypothetical protein